MLTATFIGEQKSSREGGGWRAVRTGISGAAAAVVCDGNKGRASRREAKGCGYDTSLLLSSLYQYEIAAGSSATRVARERRGWRSRHTSSSSSSVRGQRGRPSGREARQDTIHLVLQCHYGLIFNGRFILILILKRSLYFRR